MLVLRLEHWPKGDERKRQDLGQVHIHTVGQSGDHADYSALWYRDKPDGAGRQVETAEIRDWPRKRLGPWKLAARAVYLLLGWQFNHPRIPQ